MRRRDLLAGLAALPLGQVLAPQPCNAQVFGPAPTPPDQAVARFNMTGFRVQAWQDHFARDAGPAILVDVASRSLHFWSADRSLYRLYPCSVPLSEALTRRGRTVVIDKRAAPVWRPTPSMRRSHPDWPAEVPPGPRNPLGPFALYLDWSNYRIHGTHDPAKIGREASSGCFGLYNPDITELFGLAPVGTRVRVV